MEPEEDPIKKAEFFTKNSAFFFVMKSFFTAHSVPL
jgi:hypothetical protein